MWAAAMRVLDGRLTIGTALVFLAYLGALQWQLSAFADDVHHAADRRRQRRPRDGRARRRRGRARAAAARRRCRRVRGDVTLEHVDFGYHDGNRCCADVSLAAAPGEVVAIVGATGAGKSTLVGLIPRFFDPTAGRVLIDGHDLRDVSLASLRDQVAVVLQEPFLFPVSVAENIASAGPGAARARDRGAPPRRPTPTTSSRALPQGYDTVIGERGATLSGGERQRIAIARALLKDAPDPDPRRADERARRRDRARGGRGARAADARPHDVHHRAPAVDDPPRHHDRGARGRAGRRAGTAPGSCWRARGATGRCTTCSSSGRRRRRRRDQRLRERRPPAAPAVDTGCAAHGAVAVALCRCGAGGPAGRAGDDGRQDRRSTC